MQTLSDVERASIKSLTPNARNARTHSPKQIRQIANSIEAFVFVNPVLVDEAGIILAGHGRVAAAKRLGIDEVPIVRIGHLSQAQKRAYVIADNQLALKAGWDDEILAIEFQALADLDFDLSLTGFDMGDIDRIIADIGGTSPPDAPLSPEDGPALTPPGDLWRIGPHRLICADALRAETYTRLMQGDEAELVLTDPPCNVPINGHVSGLGKAEPPRVRYGVGRDDAGRLSRLSRVGLRQIARRQLQWRNPFHLYGLATRRNAARRRRAGLRGTQKICVWVKANGGMGSLYRSQHELVFLFKAGTKPHINNINLGR
ncbi:MAG: ParB/Srx family N-terminal domain-containing protein, partial [Pseudomonadota bacterium]